MEAFLLIERHSISFLSDKMRIGGALCVVLAESIEDIPRVTGGSCEQIIFEDEERLALFLPKELYYPCPEFPSLIEYKRGPLQLYLGKEVPGSYLFIIPCPILKARS